MRMTWRLESHAAAVHRAAAHAAPAPRLLPAPLLPATPLPATPLLGTPLLFTLLLGILLLALAGLSRPARAAPELEVLASQIAASLQSLQDPRYKTVAFSRIKPLGQDLDIDTLIDFTNVKIVQSHRFQVIDRSKLQLILKEQQIQMQDFVSAQKYQELGKVLGVDLFLYGSQYRDALVLKAIDVQNSAIAWAESFPLADSTPEASLLGALGQKTAASLDKDLTRLRQSKVKLVSFWSMDTANLFPPEAVMDQLSVALTKEANFRVVDRENIRLIAGEQALNQAAFIDEKNAKQLGELYGVDGFIYGSISRRQDGSILASMKLMDIYNGVIEWADLIRMDEAQPAAQSGAPAGPPAPPGMVLVPGGPFLMGTNSDPADATPLHQVTVNSFYMDVTEVSNLDYMKFVAERNYRPPIGWNGPAIPPGAQDWPVVGVSWDDALQYCRFVGKRLPLEAEWEKAARGGTGQNFPWSGSFSPGFTVTRESGKRHPDPVANAGRDVSPFGVKHMAGNVREWVEDAYRPYSSTRSSTLRVVRGGSWATDQTASRAYARGSSAPNLAWPDVGFRCARTVGK